MTAISPYAPPRRNSLLRQSSSSLQPTSPGGRSTAAFAFFLFVVRFWSETSSWQSLTEFFRRLPPIRRVWEWTSEFLGFNSPPRAGRIEDDGARVDDSAPVQRISTKSMSDQSEASSLDNQRNQSSAASKLKENQLLIRSVLQYWFGQYPPDISQKRLWMIASSSTDLRSRVDREITDKFENLLKDLSVSEASERWKEWCLGRNSSYGFYGKIAAIIALDQFSRHIQRHYESSESCNSTIPSIERLNKLALKTAKLFVETHETEIQCGMIPLPMYIFSLMPYRHDNTIESVEYVRKCVEQCAGMNEQMCAMLGRFRKATNRRIALLQDEARRTGRASNQNSNSNEQVEPTRFKDEDILETFQFESDLSPASKHPVHKTIVGFLTNQGIHPIPDEKSSQPMGSPVIVSLSGGVDSMVIASVLSHLKNSCGYNLKVIAVHIDYANRPESGAEANFVRRYCESLDIDFRCRQIKEVTRGITARDDYERIAREIRYDSYKEAIAESTDDEKIVVGVMLGHHRGDLRENVLSNAHKGAGPLDLSGMTSVSQNDGVTIYRPLLPLEKTFVFDYAHKFGVPYFKDTTPHWSTRGKLRNKLLPLLEEIYGEGSMNNLSNLATESDECRKLLYKSMIGPFLEKVVRTPMGIRFDTAPWKDQAIFFWKFVLRETLHSAGLGMFSDKSVLAFLERVRADKIRNAWLQCRKDYGVYLQQDGKVFVLYPKSFPWNKKDKYNVLGEAAEYGKEVKVGPWIVKPEIVEDESYFPETPHLSKKAMPDMEHLMTGKIDYFVTSPTWQIEGKSTPRPLVFCNFSKPTRPLAWKKSDLKVQQTLPLLGNDTIADKEMKDLRGKGLDYDVDGQKETNSTFLVRVSLRLSTS